MRRGLLAWMLLGALGVIAFDSALEARAARSHGVAVTAPNKGAAPCCGDGFPPTPKPQAH